MKIDIKVEKREYCKQVIDRENSYNGLLAFKSEKYNVLVMLGECNHEGNYIYVTKEFEPELLTETRNEIIGKIKTNLRKLKDKDRAENYSETIEINI